KNVSAIRCRPSTYNLRCYPRRVVRIESDFKHIFVVEVQIIIISSRSYSVKLTITSLNCCVSACSVITINNLTNPLDDLLKRKPFLLLSPNVRYPSSPSVDLVNQKSLLVVSE